MIPSKNVEGEPRKRNLWVRLGELGRDIVGREFLLLASSLAYTMAIALSPFLIVVLSLASLLGPGTQAQISSQMSTLFGEQAGTAVSSIMSEAASHPRGKGATGLLGFAVLLASASAIFSQLRYELDKINGFRSEPRAPGWRAFAKDKLLSIGLVLGFAVLSIASLILTATLAILLPKGQSVFDFIVFGLFNFLMFAVIFSCIFHYIPSRRPDWRRCWISGLCASLFYLVGKGFIGLYLARAAIDSIYGAAGSLIVFLLWSYYSSLTLLASYEFANHIIMDRPSRTDRPHHEGSAKRLDRTNGTLSPA